MTNFKDVIDCGWNIPITIKHLVMIKTQKGFDLLEKLVATNLPLARIIALKIPTDKLDCGTLIEFQQSSDSNVRNLARELALKIPTDKLDCGMLIKFQQSSDPNVRNLARELLLLNFPDTVVNNSKDEELEQKILAYFQ